MIPSGLAHAWREVDKGGPKEAVGIIAPAATAVREQFAAGPKAFVARTGHPRGGHRAEEEEADSSADEDGPRAAPGNPCTGK